MGGAAASLPLPLSLGKLVSLLAQRTPTSRKAYSGDRSERVPEWDRPKKSISRYKVILVFILNKTLFFERNFTMNLNSWNSLFIAFFLNFWIIAGGKPAAMGGPARKTPL